jgi:4-amino-4-deoxy-L-arabinose transferase-like glycosyltransferase
MRLMKPDASDASASESKLERTLRGLVSGERGWLLLIFCVALVLRLAYAMPHARIPLGNDMGVYHQLAAGLLSGEGYVSALEPHFQSWRAPGYPFFIAAIYAVVGQSAAMVILLQCLLSAWTCVLVARIARSTFDRKVALLAGFICAANPQMIHWSGEYLTETLFTCLLALGVLLCIDLRRESGWGRASLVGGVLGFATLVRPNLLLFLPLVSLYSLAFAGGEMRRRVGVSLAIPVLACAVLLPWTLRNYRVHAEFVPVASIGGVALFVGIPPSMLTPRLAALRGIPDWKFLEDGQHVLPNGYDLLPELFARPPHQALPSDFDELEQSRIGRTLFLQLVQDEPGRFAQLVGMKLSQTFNVLPKQHEYRLGDWNVAARYVEALFLCFTFALGSLGMLLSARRDGPSLLLLAIFLYHVAFQAIFRPAPRYFMPGLVLLAPFTALGLSAVPSLLESWRQRESGTRIRLATWTVVMAAFAVNAYYHVFSLRSHQLTKDWEKVVALIVGAGS